MENINSTEQGRRAERAQAFACAPFSFYGIHFQRWIGVKKSGAPTTVLHSLKKVVYANNNPEAKL